MEAAATPATPGKLALAVRATRPLYLPTSVLPGIAGTMVALRADDVRWWLAPVAMLALLLVHAATDVTNEVEDFARGVDSEDKMDNSRVFTTGLMSIHEGRRIAAGGFALAFVLGVAICLIQGPALLAIGVVGILGGFLYTGGPRPLKFLGLGDAAIVFLMGPLLTQGAYTAVTGDGFAAAAFWLGFAPGLLITSVLEANNLSDIETDAAAGVRTLAVRVGFRRARALFLLSLTLTYATPLVLWAAGLFGAWILLPLLTAPLALGRAAQARAATASGDEGLLTLAPGTAQLHQLFCLLLIAGVVLDGL